MKESVLQEIVDNLVKLMSFKTIKDNYDEFYKLFDFVKEELKDFYIKEVVINNYPNLIISNCDTKDFDVIMCGHIDVVPHNEYQAKFVDNFIYGRGSFDMKGQVSVMMSLLKHSDTSKKVALILTSDEEIGGMCCKKLIKDYNAKLAIIPDAGKNFELVVLQKGLLQLEIEAIGKSSHASEPFKGENAILELFRIYHELIKKYPLPKNSDDYVTSINLSKISGGDANNKVCDKASMVLDIRFTSDIRDEIIDDIKKISNRVNVNILDYGPMFSVNENLSLIQNFVKNTEKVLNRKVLITKSLATSDAIYFSEKNIPCILMNPIGDNLHMDNEYVEINSLYTLYEVFSYLVNDK